VAYFLLTVHVQWIIIQAIGLLTGYDQYIINDHATTGCSLDINAEIASQKLFDLGLPKFPYCFA